VQSGISKAGQDQGCQQAEQATRGVDSQDAGGQAVCKLPQIEIPAFSL